MKFKRMARYETTTMTERKARAFERKQEKMRERYPLFPDQIQVRSLEEETARRLMAQRSSEDSMRQFHARVWRESRRDYWRASDEQRAAVRQMWAGWAGPSDSTYFRYVVDYCTGVMEERDRKMKADRAASRARIDASVGAQTAMELAA